MPGNQNNAKKEEEKYIRQCSFKHFGCNFELFTDRFLKNLTDQHWSHPLKKSFLSHWIYTAWKVWPCQIQALREIGFQNDNSPKIFPNRFKSEPSGDTLYNSVVNYSLILVLEQINNTTICGK